MNENQILLYLRWYVIPLASFIFVLTVTENLYSFLLIFGIFIIIYGILAYKYRNLNFLSIIFLLWSISLASFFWYNYKFYYHNVYKPIFVKKTFYIDDTYKLGQYILKDDFGWHFIWKNMAIWYKIGEQLKIYGFLVPTSGTRQSWTKHFLSDNLSINNFLQIGTFNYDKFLKMKQINGTIYVKAEYSKNKIQTSFFGTNKQFIIDKIRQLYINYPDKYKALVGGLLIGDKSLLDKKTYNEFIHSGLVHIIVVSWGNMMFFMIFLSLGLFFIPFYPRLVIIWIFLVIYALSCWADSSVIRALIMWILWLIALFFGQMVSTQRLLWLAFMIMLLYNPYFLVYDLWFILSFLAILWILTFNKFQFKIWNDQYLPWILAYKTTFKEFKKAISSRKDNLKYQLIVSSMKFWNNYMLPTFWASLFTAPAILFFTKQVNILAFWASLAVIMLVPIIMFVNFIALVMISLNIPGYDLLVQANKPLLDWVFFMSSVFSHNFSYFIKI